MTDLRHELVDFFADLPHWVADAGLSEEAAVGVADDLERLVEIAQDAGFPPVPADGPDPSSFPEPCDRIAAASNQLRGLFGGLGGEGWSHVVGDHTVEEHGAMVMRQVQQRATN